MKNILTILLLLLSIAATQAQTSNVNPNQEALEQLKKQYAEGKITIEEYQRQSNQIINATGAANFTVPPGTHLQKGGRCLIAGGSFLLLSAGTLATGFLVDMGSGDANIAVLATGGALGFLGVVLELAGGAQLLKAGNKLNALKVGSVAQLQPAIHNNNVGLALNF